jgi:flagellar biosynthesis protein FlhF
MRIKSFVADDVRQALALVREEMGDDAVVLDTRSVRAVKFLGMGSREQVEVMAGVDEQPVAILPEVEPVPAVAAPVRVPDEPDGAADQQRALWEELRRIKNQMNAGAEEANPWIRMLKDRGISPELLDLPREVFAAVHDRAGLVRMLSDVMSKHTAAPSVSGSVIALVGPTGVGKTTTLAKLAARYALHEGKRVAIITCDTFRIGGIEQIRVYARILNVPLEVVASPADMEQAIAKHSDADVILIDTIGRSQRNAPHLGELKELLAPAKPTEIYLVVSAGSSPSVQMDVVKSFSVLSPNRLVISKTDESDLLGCIVSLPIATGLPISCITNGQNVPDDLRMGESDLLADLVVGVAQ